MGEAQGGNKCLLKSWSLGKNLMYDGRRKTGQENGLKERLQDF